MAECNSSSTILNPALDGSEWRAPAAVLSPVPFNGRLGDPRAGMGATEKRKVSDLWRELIPDSAHILVTIPTELSRLPVLK
jgi:hypothetical protein